MPHDHDILIVEDDDDSRDGLAALLRNGDIRVRTASTGREALGVLESGFGPCLILLDYRMRDMDGGSFLVALRSGGAESTPVVLITGDIEAAARTRELGVQDAIVKPIDPRAIRELVAKHCGAR